MKEWEREWTTQGAAFAARALGMDIEDLLNAKPGQMFFREHPGDILITMANHDGDSAYVAGMISEDV